MSMVFRNCSSTTVGSHEKLDRDDLNSTNQSATGLMNRLLEGSKVSIDEDGNGAMEVYKVCDLLFLIF